MIIYNNILPLFLLNRPIFSMDEQTVYNDVMGVYRK